MTSASHEKAGAHRCQIRMTSPATRCFGSASCPCSSWVPACWAEAPCCWYRRYHHYFTDFRRAANCDPGARNRHSDNEKFCNDLNGPKTPKMSERPLKTLQDFPTSKLNTRVRFPSPAPSPFNDLATGSDFIPTNGLLYTTRSDAPSDRLFRASLGRLPTGGFAVKLCGGPRLRFAFHELPL
jgi:hypothetical protein